MKDLWTPGLESDDPVETLARVSRLIGADPALVLHGGGNTSVKTTETDVTGRPVDVVHVKGSGWDLGTIEPAGFAPLRRERLLELLALDSLTDARMVNEVRQASLRADAPTASIEALLHARIPHRFVLHSHADAIVAVLDQQDSASRVAAVFGPEALVIPYVMPGFDLAKEIDRLWPAVGSPSALLLVHHGLFTFGATAEEAYRAHIRLVTLAEEALASPVGLTETERRPEAELEVIDPVALATFRRDASRLAGRPLLAVPSASAHAARFAALPVAELEAATRRGPATMEHVIRTKREPLLGRDLAGYAARYEDYVARHRGDAELTPLDPAPRVVLDPEWGLVTLGGDVREAGAARDIYEHTIRIVEAADAGHGYTSLDEQRSFQIEYWELEQARLKLAPTGGRFRGQVALVTGAASGIGRAIAERMLADGAAVVAVDRSPAVAEVSTSAAWHGVVADLTEAQAVARAVAEAARRFGGLDILIPAAGVFPAPTPLAELGDDAWELGVSVNATALARLLRHAHPLLALSPVGGRVVLVGTKNVTAPGFGAAAYSATKAAANQLTRVAALEWAADGIRVNTIDPDAVFDTGIWTPELIAERADSYGLTPEEYKTRNLMRAEVRSADVAAAVAALCTDDFRVTTGARVPVDGGNDRVI